MVDFTALHFNCIYWLANGCKKLAAMKNVQSSRCCWTQSSVTAKWSRVYTFLFKEEQLVINLWHWFWGLETNSEKSETKATSFLEHQSTLLKGQFQNQCIQARQFRTKWRKFPSNTYYKALKNQTWIDNIIDNIITHPYEAIYSLRIYVCGDQCNTRNPKYHPPPNSRKQRKYRLCCYLNQITWPEYTRLEHSWHTQNLYGRSDRIISSEENYSSCCTAFCAHFLCIVFGWIQNIIRE